MILQTGIAKGEWSADRPSSAVSFEGVEASEDLRYRYVRHVVLSYVWYDV